MSSVARTFGRYDLLLELSKGPFGSLWIARPSSGDRDVVLLRRLPQSDRISSAAEWAVAVRGPGILDAIESMSADGEVGLVTRYHPGEPLRSLLRLANFKRRAFVPGAALRVALDVLDALESMAKTPSAPAGLFASTALLPDSIVVGTDGRSLVIDVGIGAAIRRDPAHTSAADVAAYLAPEELDPDAKSDERTNVFALGVLLWEMMSGGRRLFYGTTHDAIADRIKTAAVPRLDASRPPGGGPIPKVVADLVARALDRDRQRRFESHAAMRSAITALGSEFAGTATEVSAIVSALAGNALSARDRSIERAQDPNAAAEAQPAANTGAAAPTPSAEAKPKTTEAAATSGPAAAAAAKRTLLGIAPAKPSRMPSIPGATDVKAAASAPQAAREPAEQPKPVTPPIPVTRSAADSSPELTPLTAARLSGLKPPKPALSKQPSPSSTAAKPAAAKSDARAKRPESASTPLDDEAPPSADRRLLDALTHEPVASERSQGRDASSATKGNEERDSVTPSESLTASKDSAPPPRRPDADARTRKRRWIGYGGITALAAAAVIALSVGRHTTRTAIQSDPATGAPAAVTAQPTNPEPPAVSATPAPEPVAPAPSEIAPPPAPASSHKSEIQHDAPTAGRHAVATPAPAPRHTGAAANKPAKKPAKFTPPDI